MEDILLSKINRYKAHPDDVIIIKFSDASIYRRATDSIEHFRGNLKRAFPDNTIIILAPGVEMEIVSKEKFDAKRDESKSDG